MSTLLVGLFVVLTVWRLVRYLTRPSSLLVDVAGPAKEHWLKGNLHRIFKDGIAYNLELVKKYGGVVKVYGLFGEEQLYVSDPRALHHVVVKEEHVYQEADMFIMGNRLIFGEGLVSTLGEQHKKQRKMLNPVFSLQNMRTMLPAIQPIAIKLRQRLIEQLPIDGGATEINLLPWITLGTFEYITQAGLGYSFDALGSNPDHEYPVAVRSLAPTFLKIMLLRPLIPVVVRNFSLYWRNKIVDWAPIKPLREMRRLVGVMESSCRNILEEKRRELASLDTYKGHGGARTKDKDIMSILLRTNASSTEADRLTESEILGQMNTIVFAGFETTAMATCRILHVLAMRPEVQARLCSEVRRAKLAFKSAHQLPEEQRWQDVELPYDELMALPYLDAIVRETLRVYPPSSLFNRTTTQTATLPLQYPIRSASGAEISSVAVPKGTTVIISILASNHNKAIWGEDASMWKPERWLTPSGERISEATVEDRNGMQGEEGSPGTKAGVKYPGVYSNMMTFLGGSRACIGFKFAEMEMKQVIADLISTMQFSLPSAVDAFGNRKEIYWRMDALQVPVVRSPAGDDRSAQVPLDVRLVNERDFSE
ncbi:cytochrome P450 [Artomyces pyxidatus]|uniref:Cytochrome P450 n=1 Tax=Artomyces pyxidatus TaxID=48021 RepID=A0ACB8SM99_9AGAM|nr:cytochrome P450 [Artomyces pyxidatus]